MALTDAVKRGRGRVRLAGRVADGLGRVRASWWSIGQSALAGALAWEAAVVLLGHPSPFFAAVAAIVSLSISYLGRIRRVVEISVGVTIGVAIGDLVVREIGRGAWQLGVVVLVAMTAALLLDGGVLIVTQAALQAVFVTALPAPPEGYLGRWQDALLGGAVALGVAFALPPDPRRGLRTEADDLVATLARALRQSSRAARAGDPDEAFAALELARGTEPALDAWRGAVRAGWEISRISPLRRRALPEIRTHLHAMDPLDRAVRNLRVALRRMVAVVEDHQLAGDGDLPTALLDRIEELAGALHTVPGALRDPGGEGGRRAVAALSALAARLDPGQLSTSLSTTVVVAQLRSAVVDLLQIPGLTPEEARALLPR